MQIRMHAAAEPGPGEDRIRIVAHAEAAKAAEPRQRALHNPAVAAESRTRLHTKASNAGSDSTPAQIGSAAREVIALSACTFRGRRRSRPARVRRSGGMDSMSGSNARLSCRLAGERRTASGIPLWSTTRWRLVPGRPRSVEFGPVRSPPCLAAMLALSTAARLQSIRSASCRRFSRAWWSLSQTPALCQSRSLRQQVMPLPQPSSCGSIRHGIPERRTKRIPSRAARAGP